MKMTTMCVVPGWAGELCVCVVRNVKQQPFRICANKILRYRLKHKHISVAFCYPFRVRSYFSTFSLESFCTVCVRERITGWVSSSSPLTTMKRRWRWRWRQYQRIYTLVLKFRDVFIEIYAPHGIHQCFACGHIFRSYCFYMLEVFSISLSPSFCDCRPPCVFHVRCVDDTCRLVGVSNAPLTVSMCIFDSWTVKYSRSHVLHSTQKCFFRWLCRRHFDVKWIRLKVVKNKTDLVYGVCV